MTSQRTPSTMQLFRNSWKFLFFCNILLPNDDNSDFRSFLCSKVGQNIMTNNTFSIHVDSGNILYQNLNRNENCYGFLLAQQDESKRLIHKRISYSHSFEKCMKSFWLTMLKFLIFLTQKLKIFIVQI